MNDAYPDLVRQATLAASSHNTQPWTFRLLADGMDILPDFSRRLPVVDPDNHHLFASLGCAAENLLHASAAAGLRGYFSSSPGEPGAHVHFEKANPSRSPLFEAIPHRQCCRSDYDGSAITGEHRRLLEAAAQGTGVSLLWLTGSQKLEAVAEYVAQGNQVQLVDPAWRKELKDWVRFSAAETRRTGDGLYGPVMGNPSVPRWLGSLAMRLSLSARNQNAKDCRQIRQSSAVVVFFSEVDNWQHWIEAGRSYERFALQAT